MIIDYWMHVDWRYVAERQHFLALELRSAGDDVSIHYLRAWNRSVLVDRPVQDAAVSPVVGAPDRAGGPGSLPDRILIRAAARRSRPGAATFVTHVRWWPLVARLDRAAAVVYDASDYDADLHPRHYERLRDLNRRLVGRADLVVAASACIAEALARDVPGSGDRTVVVGNALRGDYAWPVTSGPAPTRAAGGEPRRAVYFGTIGHWVDQRLFRAVLDADPHLTIDVYGPVVTPWTVEGGRVRLMGPLPHEELLAACQQYDLALLPFEKSDVTDRVDPVKIYEYVALGLPVLATPLDTLSGEVGDFVTFAEGASAWRDAVPTIRPVGEAEWATRADFVRRQTWARRAAMIRERMAQLGG